MDKKGLLIGIIGGIGLGLLLGSEFSSRNITILGAIFVVISIVAIVAPSFNKN
jgi:Na+/H+-dicarboxylate symporter